MGFKSRNLQSTVKVTDTPVKNLSSLFVKERKQSFNIFQV